MDVKHQIIIIVSNFWCKKIPYLELWLSALKMYLSTLTLTGTDVKIIKVETSPAGSEKQQAVNLSKPHERHQSGGWISHTPAQSKPHLEVSHRMVTSNSWYVGIFEKYLLLGQIALDVNIIWISPQKHYWYSFEVP